MANIGHFIDRNPNVPFAGLPTVLSDDRLDECMKFGNTEEMAQYWLKAKCKHNQLVNAGPLWKHTPYIHSGSVKDLLESDLSKSRFVRFKEKFSENMYFKSAKLGLVKPTHSKPDNVTNSSRTFGVSSKTSDPLYQTILPPKTAEEVNREFSSFHDKYILSHNHYFPGEQINRYYDDPFSRYKTYGIPYKVDDTGNSVKRCTKHCKQQLVISKAQMDFIDRTRDRLGKKYKKYPYDVPEDMMHGAPNKIDDCDGKMLIENIEPCVKNTKFIDAFAHLIKMRRKISESNNLHDLLSTLERNDKDKTGYMPLSKIFETLQKLRVRINNEKMRTALSHFDMIVDKDTPMERVNYEQFCRLLMIQLPLPKTGNISIMPANVYNKETTYRMFCEDIKKKPNELPVGNKKFKSFEQLDMERTSACDLIRPSIPTLYGLGPSEFERVRSRDEMERIFKHIVGDKRFDEIWNVAVDRYKEQNSRVSINQLRELVREEDLIN